METEPIKPFEPEPVITGPKNKFKPLAIIFIVLTVILAVATGFFVWKYFERGIQIEDLNKEISQTQTKSADTDQADNQPAKDPNVVTEAELRQAYQDANLGSNIGNIGINISDSKIENSKVSPWQTILVGMGAEQGGGSGAYFYRYGPTGEWRYAFSGQMVGSCSDYKNVIPNVKVAFTDFTCYSSMAPMVESTIGEYFKL